MVDRYASRIIGGTLLALVVAGLVGCTAPKPPAGPGPTSATPQTSATGPANSASPSTPASNPATATSTAPDSTSGIAVNGTVLSSPGCPGPAVAESPCPDRPVAGARVELTSGTTVVATTRTDTAGRFELRVPSGNYQITAFNVGFASHASQPISVTGPVTVRLVVDSGMR
jgi:hypothetical protein